MTLIQNILLLAIPLITAQAIGLLLCHPVSDNASNKENGSGEQCSLRSLGLQSLLIGFLGIVLLGTRDTCALLAGVVLFFVHFLYGFARGKFPGTSHHSLRNFLLLRTLYLIVIALLAYAAASKGLSATTNLWYRWFGITFYQGALLIFGAITCISTGEIVVSLALRPFCQKLESARKAEDKAAKTNGEKPKAKGFENGGKTIGYLERALIFIFVITNYPAGIGFLVAAKSVFRFGELNNRSNRMEAEYIIIGTLYSFLWGIFSSNVVYALLLYTTSILQ